MGKIKSIIKWQTGKPKDTGSYLITTINRNVCYDYWTVFPTNSCWQYHSKFDVVAWCKLSDIKPYKNNIIDYKKYYDEDIISNSKSICDSKKGGIECKIGFSMV